MARRLIFKLTAAWLVIGASPFIQLAQAQPSAPEDAEESTILPDPNAPQRLPLERPPTPAPSTRPAAGSADSQNLKPQYGLLGNLGGVRDLLWDRGVLFNMDYVYEAATNVAGGDRGPLLLGAGQLAIRGLFDFQKMFDWEGASGGITISHREGRSLALDAHLDTQTSVQEIYGRGRIWRLSQFWFDQKLGPYVDLKFGRLPVNDDFGGFACEFQLNSLCGSVVSKIASNYIYTFPVSQWATRLRIGTPDSVYLQVGAYQVNPDDVNEGFNFGFSNATGALIVTEAGWFPKIGGDAFAGSYKIGGWYETGGGNDVYLNDRGLPLAMYKGQPLHRGDRTGFYFTGVQEIYRPDPANKTRNLSAFVRAAAADEETATYSSMVTAGVIYKGWCAERPNDWLGLGVGQTTPNPRLVDAISMSNLLTNKPRKIPTQEKYIEAFYSIDVADNVIIRPNIQYITRNGSPLRKTDAVVLGFKSLINF